MRNPYRSFFWPGVLILIGVFALLVNAGLLPTDRLYRVVDLWPLILVVIGLELIVRRAFQGTAADLAGALIVLLAAGGAVAYVAVGPPIPGGTHTLEASSTVGSLDHASLQVDAGAATLKLTGSSSLDKDLYRAHIEYSGAKPQVSLDRESGDLRISQGNNFGWFQSRRFVLDLQINSSLPWTIETNTGASKDTFNLAGVHVASLSINTGASTDDIFLGKPSRIVPVTVNGGALTVHVHRPAGTPVSVRVSGGAVSLTADGQQQRGIGSESWESSSFGGASDAYRIEINGGACTVTVDAGGGSG